MHASQVLPPSSNYISDPGSSVVHPTNTVEVSCLHPVNVFSALLDALLKERLELLIVVV